MEKSLLNKYMKRHYILEDYKPRKGSKRAKGARRIHKKHSYRDMVRDLDLAD